MGHRVCPWWIGYLLASPLRRLLQDPAAIVGSFVKEGMIILEPGPGMGFFTLEMARRVGPKGRVIAVDVQPQMLAGLARRARNAGLAERIETRQASGEHLGVDDLKGRIDFALAFAMVHEVPQPALFLQQIAHSLRPGAKLLLAEPAGHVSKDLFAAELDYARKSGLSLESQPAIRRSQTAVLVRR